MQREFKTLNESTRCVKLTNGAMQNPLSSKFQSFDSSILLCFKQLYKTPLRFLYLAECLVTILECSIAHMTKAKDTSHVSHLSSVTVMQSLDKIAHVYKPDRISVSRMKKFQRLITISSLEAQTFHLFNSLFLSLLSTDIFFCCHKLW